MKRIFSAVFMVMLYVTSAVAVHDENRQIPTTNYVQNFFRGYCKNPMLKFNNVSETNIPSEKYILSAIDMVNMDTAFAVDARTGNPTSMLYLKSSVEKLKMSPNCCVVPWLGNELTKTILNTPVLQWTHYQNPAREAYYIITFGQGKFIAAGVSNILSYSEDGKIWVSSDVLPSYDRWYAATYGNNTFVLIAELSNVATWSNDGLEWYQTTMPESGNWRSVIYGKDRFIAVGEYMMAESVDGEHWVPISLDVQRFWFSVSYSPDYDRYVVVPKGSDVALWSDDGKVWNTATLPASAIWASVTYGDGRFVAVAYNTNKIAWSDDGKQWHETNTPQSGPWEYVTFGGGVFVAVGYNSNLSVYSFDGIRWFVQKLPSREFWQATAHNGEIFVAIAGTGYGGASSANLSAVGKLALQNPTIWALGQNCVPEYGDTVPEMCDVVYVGGTGTCDDAICSCKRTYLFDSGWLNKDLGPSIVVPRDFVDYDACMAQCADICADNALNNTDGLQNELLCGK